MFRTSRLSLLILTIALVGGALLIIGGAAPAQASPNAGANPRTAMNMPVGPGDIVISALNNEQYLPAVAYNSVHHEYLVVWHNKWGAGNRDIYAQRISDSGEVQNWIVVAAGGHDRAQPSVAYDPVRDRYLVVWIYDAAGNGSNYDVYGRFLPWNGPNASWTEFKIVDWASNQFNPRVVFAGTQQEFLVVWTNDTGASPVPDYISGRRIFADGSGFPTGGFAIASHLSENRVNAAVAYNHARNEYLVTYDNGLDIFGVRLRGDGVALGGGEFGIAGWPSAERYASVAACARLDQYLVVWQSLENGNDENIYGRYVHGNGAPEQAWFVGGTQIPGIKDLNPAVACNVQGDTYAIVWQFQYSNTTGPYGVWGRNVYANKQPGPPFTVSGAIAGETTGRTRPAIAGGRIHFLAAWEAERWGTAWQDIRGRLIAQRVLFLPSVRE
ncbi:MAG: hypothetical protein HUU23_13770 [Caldilineales bacterium]|nr:hypothetical protein [Caldilineales bacterium]